MNPLTVAAKEFCIQLCWLTTTGETAPTQDVLTNGDGNLRPGAKDVKDDGSNLNTIIAQFAGAGSQYLFCARATVGETIARASALKGLLAAL